MRLWPQLLICALFGVPMAFVAGYAALDHNPQGEFMNYETGEWTIDLYGVVAGWWGIVALPLMAICLAVWAIQKLRVR